MASLRKKYHRFKFFTGIKCHDRVHCIGISKKGRFAIIDHPTKLNFKQWDDWAELGGECPPCLSVFANTLASITSDPRNGIDRGKWDMSWYADVRFHIRGNKSGKLREHIAMCLEKRRVRRNRREQKQVHVKDSDLV